MHQRPQAAATNPSIFLRLKASDPTPREVAWGEFSERYGPVISGFARRLGARPQEVEDVIQEVLLGFFLTSPTFVYDPSKGKFRSYLKTCTYRALRQRLDKQARLHESSLENVDENALSIDQIWNDVWEREQLRLALERVRLDIGHTNTFLAFESFVIFDQPAQSVAQKLGIHLNSVYRAREQVTLLLREKVVAMNDED